jgi:hypothetical protein
MRWVQSQLLASQHKEIVELHQEIHRLHLECQALTEHVAYYHQLRFRLVDRLNMLLRRAGRIHGWSRRTLETGVQWAKRLRQSRPPAESPCILPLSREMSRAPQRRAA